MKEILSEDQSVLDSLLTDAGNEPPAGPGVEDLLLYNLPGLCFPLFEVAHYFITANTLRLEFGKHRARLVIRASQQPSPTQPLHCVTVSPLSPPVSPC